MEWISVGELGKAFAPDGNTLRHVSDLEGESFTLNFVDGSAVEYSFTSGSSLSWRTVAGERGGESGEERYTATNLCDGIYFVDFVSSGRSSASVSLVLDVKGGVATSVTGKLPSEEEAGEPLLAKIRGGKSLTGVTVDILTGTIGRACHPADRLHHPTLEMVGKRVRYVYSPTETYEHIYLNPQFYTWHCVEGAEKGLCDTDRCHYYKIANDLYLFVWREKIVPTLGVVMIDFNRMKTTGKVYGYSDFDSGSPANFPVGACATLLGDVGCQGL